MTHVQVRVRPVLPQSICILSATRIQKTGEELIRCVVDRMGPRVVCVKRQPVPRPLRVVPGKSMIVTASQRWIRRDICQEAIREVDVAGAAGHKSIEGSICRSAGAPGSWNIGRSEECRDGIHSRIERANVVAAELNWQFQTAR